MRTIVSRRRLGFGALGATLVGSGTAVADDRPNRRQLPWTFAPVPNQGGTSGLGGDYHVFGGPGQENSTIKQLQGFHRQCAYQWQRNPDQYKDRPTGLLPVHQCQHAVYDGNV